MLAHLALRGGLDEIAALRDVEAELRVRIDTTTTARNWHTVGDLFDALLLTLPPAVAQDEDIWKRFRRALCRESGDDPIEVGRETLLIRPTRHPLAWLRRLLSQ